jgi:hypothetical protein
MQDTVGVIIMVAFVLLISVCYLKAIFHFYYLKFNKKKFAKVNHLWSLGFRPIYFLEYLPELFEAMMIPILTWKGKQPPAKIVGILSYVILFLLIFVASTIIVAGHVYG